MPLGWLVESGIEQGHKFKRITNYVVLLNISTDPISLWLAYDYYPTVDGDMMTTVQLSDSEYFNPDDHSRNPKPTQQNATNPPKKEKKPSSRAVRRGILQASGFEASIEARGDQSIGTEVGLHNLPYNFKQRILEKCEYLLVEGRNELLLSREKNDVQDLVRSLLGRKNVCDVFDEDEQEMLCRYLDVDSIATFLQKYQQSETNGRQEEKSEERACLNRDGDTESNGLEGSFSNISLHIPALDQPILVMD